MVKWLEDDKEEEPATRKARRAPWPVRRSHLGKIHMCIRSLVQSKDVQVQKDALLEHSVLDYNWIAQVQSIIIKL